MGQLNSIPAGHLRRCEPRLNYVVSLVCDGVPHFRLSPKDDSALPASDLARQSGHSQRPHPAPPQRGSLHAPEETMTPKKRTSKAHHPAVSDAELLVLKQLWSEGEANPSQLRKLLAEQGVEWAYTTVQTLLHRLHEKGTVSRRKEGITQVYQATVQADEMLLDQVADMSQRLGTSPASPLVLNLVRGKRLSKNDLSTLRSMLDAAEANKGQLPGS
jgi:BlaI family transcriptional regulator, penicillinase repressor